MHTSHYILLGPPGSGKSTQAELLKKTFRLTHVDIGSELRAASEKDTELGREINHIINDRKELVPDSIVGKVLESILRDMPEDQGVLIDGAPRRLSQIDEVLDALQLFGREISGVIFIELSEKESVERISRRFLCFGCHRPYILGKDTAIETGTCPVCGGKIGQRKDDTPEGVRKRFQVFHTDTLPVIAHFEEKGLLIRIDGHQTSEEISGEIMRKIQAKN
ncbi:MAG: nucleoside monophosphate kinase [Patescibacteria group bacterium]